MWMNSQKIIASIRIPIIEWLPTYTKELFFKDLVAGMTVFVLLVPQGMAYAMLAGLPPVYGLYSSTVPLIIYAIFSTSRQLSMGPMAITSLLLGTTSEKFGYTDGSIESITLVVSISYLAGFFQVMLGVFRLGPLAEIISHSVLTGFVTGSALVIFLSQFKYILGLHVPRFTYTHQTVYYIVSHLSETNVAATCLGFGTMLLLYIIRIWKKKLESKKSKPLDNIASSSSFSSSKSLQEAQQQQQLEQLPLSERGGTTTNNERLTSNNNHQQNSNDLYVLLPRIFILLSNLSNLFAIVCGSLIAHSLINHHIMLDIVGNVPSGFQPLSFHVVSATNLISLVPASLAIAFVAFANNWAIAVKYAQLHHYEIDATQELIASGLASMFGICFNCFFVAGGLARSAVNAESGAMTQMAAIITAIAMVIALCLFTKWFYYIPMSVLAAVIEVSVLSMIDFESMRKAYSVDRRDCFVMVITFLVTFFVGIVDGLFVGIFCSFAVVMKSVAFPHIVHLGRLPIDHLAITNTNIDYPMGLQLFKDITRFPEAEQLPTIAIVRIDASLFFGNVAHFKTVVKHAAEGHFHTSPQPISTVIIDASAWIDLDYAGLEALSDIRHHLQQEHHGCTLWIACAKGIIRDKLQGSDFTKTVSLSMTIDDAIVGRNSPQFLIPSDQRDMLQHHPDRHQLIDTSSFSSSEGEGDNKDEEGQQQSTSSSSSSKVIIQRKKPSILSPIPQTLQSTSSAAAAVSSSSSSQPIGETLSLLSTLSPLHHTQQHAPPATKTVTKYQSLNTTPNNHHHTLKDDDVDDDDFEDN
jgi:sulfate permease, SulP family